MTHFAISPVTIADFVNDYPTWTKTPITTKAGTKIMSSWLTPATR